MRLRIIIVILLVFCELVVLLQGLSKVAFAQKEGEVLSVSSDSGYIVRYAYPIAPAPLILKTKNALKAGGGLLSNNLTSVLASIGGIASVIGGSVFTWIKLRKKTVVFKSYLKRVEDAETAYQSDKKLIAFKETIKKIQEEGELAAANGSLTQEQLNAVSRKIERVLGQSSSS